MIITIDDLNNKFNIIKNKILYIKNNNIVLTEYNKVINYIVEELKNIYYFINFNLETLIKKRLLDNIKAKLIFIFNEIETIKKWSN